MTLPEKNPARRNPAPSLFLWIGPWVIYLVTAVATVTAEELHRHGHDWLLFLTRNGVMRIVLALLIAQWLAARITLGLRGSALVAGIVAVLELPVIWLVFMAWLVFLLGPLA